MLAKNSTKSTGPVEQKYGRFPLGLDSLHMNTHSEIPSDSEVLGRKLREIRRVRKWTLKDFENASDGEIKDVVLGSYERGSRSMSVSKLRTIAQIYEVPIEVFFGNNQKTHLEHNAQTIVIDLRKLREADERNNATVLLSIREFTSGVARMRQDWNGEIISLRNADVTFLAIMASVTTVELIKEYEDSKILFGTKG
jgi:transcriptional regulator with XRE-family HTH domain